MLSSLHYAAATLDHNLTIHAANEMPVSLIHTPQQHTKKAFLDIGIRARTKALENRRDTYKGLHEIDTHTYKLSIAHQPEDNKRILLNIHAGGATNNQFLETLGLSNDDKCIHCGNIQTKHHLTWECESMHEARHNTDNKQLITTLCKHYATLPNPILLGIPIAMGTDPTKTYWSNGTPDLIHDQEHLFGATYQSTIDREASYLIQTTWHNTHTQTHPPTIHLH